MYLVRKINPAKWEEKRLVAQGLSPGAVSADAVTADLRTRNNALSFWRVGSAGQEDIEQAMLALACGYQRLDRLVVVWIDEDDFRSHGLEVEPSPGRTTLCEWQDRHVDVVRLDYEGLGTVARHIQRAMRRASARWRGTSSGRCEATAASRGAKERFGSASRRRFSGGSSTPTRWTTSCGGHSASKPDDRSGRSRSPLSPPGPPVYRCGP